MGVDPLRRYVLVIARSVVLGRRSRILKPIRVNQ
jgi:hypothetical protein